MTASLEAAIFSVPSLGVDDLAAVFTLDSAHTGVTVNEIFHQGVLIFAFPLFRCHRRPPLVLWVYGGYQNGSSHFRTIKRCDCKLENFLGKKITARIKRNLKMDGLNRKIVFKYGKHLERLHSTRKQCRRIYICLFCVVKYLLGNPKPFLICTVSVQAAQLHC